MIEDRAVELAASMQAAALDPTLWEPALNAASAFVGGSGVVLLSVDARERFAPVSTDMAEMVEDYFARGWHLNDVREACVPLLRTRGIVLDHDYQSIEAIEDCDYYHDFLVRHRRKWFAGIGATCDGEDWCLALQRSPDIGPYDARDMPNLQILRGALSNAVSLSRHVGRSWVSGLQHALDVMGQAAIVFDHKARVLHINDAAATLVGALVSREGTLEFRNAHTGAKFGAMLRTALSPLERRAEASVQTIHLGHEKYLCRATSLLADERLAVSSAAVLVVLKRIARSPASIMKAKFGLTDAEVKVSIALAAGKSVKEVALANDVKAETIRHQLKSVYSKTHINKQSQLVAFVRDLTSKDQPS